MTILRINAAAASRTPVDYQIYKSGGADAPVINVQPVPRAGVGEQSGPGYIVEISEEGRRAYETGVLTGAFGLIAPRSAAAGAPGLAGELPLAQTAIHRIDADSAPGPAYVLDISGAGLRASKVQSECQTCKNRKYVDVSGDAAVSFQAPGHIDPAAAPTIVAAHEGEHVSNERAYAANEGRRIVSQSVSLSASICEECGRIYISGGETRTVSVEEK